MPTDLLHKPEMRSIVLAHEVDWGGWRSAARGLALDGVPPENVVWSVGAPDGLFTAEAPETLPDAAPSGTFTVPRALVGLAGTCIQHRDPERFALLYRLIWRAHGGERHIMEQAVDPELARAQRLARSVRRDAHRMGAFLRFRAVEQVGHTRYVSWFEPDHYILEANAALFVRRFGPAAWSILTPYRGAHWDGARMHLTPGVSPRDVPDDDALEACWRARYGRFFDPARRETGAMPGEMPEAYWRSLPEAVDSKGEQPVIPPPKAARVVAPPPERSAPAPLKQAAQDAESCRRCALWEAATQMVFGEGPAEARVMFVGEQPGDQEDLAGRPFVGPAGQIFDRAMEEAGLDRRDVYITNAVKHFKFIMRGKRRIHEKPGTVEIAACKHWLDLERETVRPALTVMMGATAARAVLGRVVSITRERGRPMALDGNAQGFVTVHPSYLLRLPDEEKAREYARFVDDLRKVGALVRA